MPIPSGDKYPGAPGHADDHNDITDTLRDHDTRIVELEGAPGGGVTDHGALTGLADDDHTQYHTDARGDARYSQLSHTHTQAQSHDSPDTDSSTTALHHTLGTGANQAAAGNHTHAAYAASSHTHAAADVNSGTLATARLGSGTADSTKFLRGDSTWAVPAGGGGATTLNDLTDVDTTGAADGEVVFYDNNPNVVTHTFSGSGALGTADTGQSTTTAGAGTWTQGSGQASGSGTRAIAVWDTGKTDVQARFTIDTIPAAGAWYSGVVLRYINSTTYVLVEAMRTGGGQLRLKIYSNISDSFTQIADVDASAWLTGSNVILEGRITGNSVTAWINGTQRTSATLSGGAETTFASSTLHGMFHEGGAQKHDTMQIDDPNAVGTYVVRGLDASQVTSGVFSVSRLGTGTPTGSKFLRDDGTFAVPASGGVSVGKKVNLYYPRTVSATQSAAMTLNRLMAVPFLVRATETFDRIALEVRTAGTAGAVLRLGIYADDGGGYPGALTLDAGTVSSTTTGLKTITISQSLSAGLYWLVAVAQTAVCNVSVGTTADTLEFMASSDPTQYSFSLPEAFFQDSVSGALPANFTTTVSTSGTNSGPNVVLRGT